MKLLPKAVTGDENALLKSISLSDTNLDRHRKTTETKTIEKPIKLPPVPPPQPTPSTSTDLTPRAMSREKREDGTSYAGSEMNSTNDLEMDYYDYDIQNAGNIPGSYLLEPSFVFWTDPLDSFSDQGDQGIELLNTSTSMNTTSSSVGLFTPEPSRDIRETSFDTLDGYHIKFVDDDDDDDDGDRTISDSIDSENKSFLRS